MYTFIRKTTPFSLFIVLLFLCQTALGQIVRSKTYYNPSSVSIDGCGTYCASLPGLTFSTADFPCGSVVTDVNVIVEWAKADGACASPGTGCANLEEVSFALQGPSATVNLATPGTWGGCGSTGSIPIAFNQGYGLLLPGAPPAAGTYSPSGGNLNTMNFTSPFGTWSLLAGDDMLGAPLCVTYYTITISAATALDYHHVSKSVSFPASVVVDGCGTYCTAMPSVTINTSDFNLGAEICDVNVYLNWRKTDGSCSFGLSGCSNHAQTSFRLDAPGGNVILATPGTWSGCANTPWAMTAFDQQASAVPSGAPVTGTYLPNGGSLFDLAGTSPHGTWTVSAGDNGVGDPLCMYSYVIEVAGLNPPSPPPPGPAPVDDDALKKDVEMPESVVEEQRIEPKLEASFEVFPNPVSSSTTIKFSVDQPEYVVLRIGGIDGKSNQTLFAGNAEPGRQYEIPFQPAETLANGIYYATLISRAGTVETLKVVVQR